MACSTRSTLAGSADLDATPDEKIKELAVGPDFAEAELEEAARRSIRAVEERSGHAMMD
jgi:hypothetical protein